MKVISIILLLVALTYTKAVFFPAQTTIKAVGSNTKLISASVAPASKGNSKKGAKKRLASIRQLKGKLAPSASIWELSQSDSLGAGERIRNVAASISDGVRGVSSEELQAVYDRLKPWNYIDESTDDYQDAESSLTSSGGAGDCEDYSGCLVAICEELEAIGRVVIGYFREQSGVDACHAWPEILIDGEWINCDWNQGSSRVARPYRTWTAYQTGTGFLADSQETTGQSNGYAIYEDAVSHAQESSASPWNRGGGDSPITGTVHESNTAYTVQRGDTLYRIARNHGVTVDHILRTNHLTSTVINPGQTLTIQQ